MWAGTVSKHVPDVNKMMIKIIKQFCTRESAYEIEYLDKHHIGQVNKTFGYKMYQMKRGDIL